MKQDIVTATKTTQTVTRYATIEILSLLCVLGLACWLRFWKLEQNGFGNSYYAAAVRSMMEDSHNFFFGSFDPAGFVTVDKPPLALWFQVLSAKLFGYKGVSLLIPQGVMGVLSCLMVYLIGKRFHDGWVGVLAALILATTPISVAVDRDNLPDSCLVLTLLVSAWFLIIAAERGSLKWLCIGVAIVGVAFNIKMLAAFVVLPAYYAVYFLSDLAHWKRRLVHLGLASPLLFLTALSWSLVVDATPVAKRPFIGGTQKNSAIELAIGYNGFGRVFGGSGNINPGGGMGRRQASTPTDRESKSPQQQGFGPPGFGPPSFGSPGPGGMGPPGMMGGMGGFGGPAGWARFTYPLLASQITWFMPLALLGAVGFIVSTSFWNRWSASTISTALWLGWLLTHLVVFRYAKGIFHEYYSTVMGPAVAMVAAIAIASFLEQASNTDWRRSLLPTGLLLTLGWQMVLIGRVPELRYNALPIVGVMVVVGVALVLWQRSPFLSSERAWKLAKVGTIVCLAGLLIGPSLCSYSSIAKPGNSLIPTADVGVLFGRSLPGPPMMGPMGSSHDAEQLLVFLTSNRAQERILLACRESMTAGPLIIKSGLPIVATGGFMGSDPAMTLDGLKEMVERKEIRFVMNGGGMPMMPPMGGGPSGGGPPGSNVTNDRQEVDKFIAKHGKRVPEMYWKKPSVANAAMNVLASFLPGAPSIQLIDLQPELGWKEPEL